MRALLFSLLVCTAACEPPLRPPAPAPADPGGLTGCRSQQMADGLWYSCNHYVVVDNELGAGSTLLEIQKQLVDHAHATNKEPTPELRTFAGGTQAVLVSYQQNGRHSLDLVATQTRDGIVRGVECHVPWFEGDRMVTFEKLCERAMTTLLGREPAGRKLSPACKRATQRLTALPDRTDPADGSPELRGEVSDFANRCTETIAACALAAKTYVEATLCRD